MISYLSFSVWFTLLSMTISWPICVAENGIFSFFFFFFVSFYVYVYGPSQIKFLWIVQSSGWNLLLQFCFHVDIQLFQQKFLKCFPIEFPRNLYQNSINGMYVCLCLYLFDFMDLLLFIYTNQSVLINVPL